MIPLEKPSPVILAPRHLLTVFFVQSALAEVTIAEALNAGS